jgi:hypothetical protein
VVRVGNPSGNSNHLGLSTDGGITWAPAATEPAGVSSGGGVAVNADGTRVVWSPGGGAVNWSADAGATWTPAVGVPAGATVESDRVRPTTFYAFAGGTFFTSTDGGATFVTSAATGLPATGNVRFKAVPGVAGHLWFAGGNSAGTYGMWRSTDGGATFTQLPAPEEADAVGFGKAAPGRSYPAIYTTAKIGGVRGIFRSDDAGGRWVRINDDEHQYAWTGATITGDPRVYGRVYLATNGRGIICGDS